MRVFCVFMCYCGVCGYIVVCAVTSLKFFWVELHAFLEQQLLVLFADT